MKSSELAKLGVPKGEAMRIAGLAIRDALQRSVSKKNIRKQLRAVIENPAAHQQNKLFADLAIFLVEQQEAEPLFVERDEPAPFQVWGEDIDENSLQQMENACALPVAVRGAVMPDAHVGYGLPIGGVLATRNSVIPYAVGVDIACRMKLTVLDMPVKVLNGQQDRLSKVLREETAFGKKGLRQKRNHDVMDEDWNCTPITGSLKDKAWTQLGSSGGGNHFVEFGELTIEHDQLGIPAGTYLALLSHSGSRGAGSLVANHYSKLAMSLHPELPKQLRFLAWLDLDSQEGQEYWRAMQLMGKYAAANHACIHHHVAKALGAESLLSVENHHNFAWKEIYDGEEYIVHRKGATPAAKGVMGIIPGSMASPAYLVTGKGNLNSLNSASHGAGRRLSRRIAKESLTWSDTKKLLAEQDVTLIGAGLDEAPMAYKDINAVMAAQSDLVEIEARFDPKLVRMASD